MQLNTHTEQKKSVSEFIIALFQTQQQKSCVPDENEEANDSLFQAFAASTSAHGFLRLAEAKHFMRKVIWAVLLCAALIGVILLLGFR